MRWVRAALVAWSLAVSLPAETSLPLESMMPLLADLASRGSYGIHYAERGAFLVRDEDGEVGCILWPFTGEFHKISYSVPIPPGTIAIAHTHPRCCRDLSAGDRRESQRLHLPIIAVSMGTMHLTDGSETAKTARRGIRWSHFEEPGKQCRPATPSEPGAGAISSR